MNTQEFRRVSVSDAETRVTNPVFALPLQRAIRATGGLFLPILLFGFDSFKRLGHEIASEFSGIWRAWD